MLDDTERQKLINLDEGYYIFRTIRNSPAYLEKRKKMHLQCSDSLVLHHYSSLSHVLKQSGQNY